MEHAQSLLSLSAPPSKQQLDEQQAELSLIVEHSIPYLILMLNYVIFKLMRSFIHKIFSYYTSIETTTSQGKKKDNNNKAGSSSLRLFRLLATELISTCELCADCAELNVVYEKHGSLAYGVALFFLSYLWVEAFEDAHTTPGYLAEDYFLDKGNELLKSGDAYARFIGQSLAMPLAWRLATLYWKYHLLSEHSSMLKVENCHSSLATSSLNGFVIELVCCLICRLAELCGHKLLEHRYLSQQAVSALCSFVCSVLVVLALELSGGYFNPILAASLEYGCKGIEWYQHALVFWLGPLAGHVLARALFRCYSGERAPSSTKQLAEARLAEQRRKATSEQQAASRKAPRTSSRRKSRSDKID